MAPERFDGRCDERSDVYALGATLYELVTLVPAFQAEGEDSLVRSILKHELVAPRFIRSHVPPELNAVIVKAMARDPALASLVEARIRDSLEDGVGATLAAGDELAKTLRSLDDELLAARADDVLDVVRRIARRLAGVPEPEAVTFDAPAIVVAHDLVPSAAATLPRDRLLGFALETGSPTAHAGPSPTASRWRPGAGWAPAPAARSPAISNPPAGSRCRRVASSMGRTTRRLGRRTDFTNTGWTTDTGNRLTGRNLAPVGRVPL